MAMYAALPTWDAAATDRFISRQRGMVGIGTDPAEWVTDAGTLGRLLSAQAEAMPGMVLVPSDLHVFTEGSVGWAADQPIARMPDGSEVPLRMTAVLHREDGSWKVVQTHWSIGLRNEEAFPEDAVAAMNQRLAGDAGAS
jgi:hypothetical protein